MNPLYQWLNLVPERSAANLRRRSGAATVSTFIS